MPSKGNDPVGGFRRSFGTFKGLQLGDGGQRPVQGHEGERRPGKRQVKLLKLMGLIILSATLLIVGIDLREYFPLFFAVVLSIWLYVALKRKWLKKPKVKARKGNQNNAAI
jgi:hypothetical protein